jgi:hypothetical protein
MPKILLNKRKALVGKKELASLILSHIAVAFNGEAWHVKTQHKKKEKIKYRRKNEQLFMIGYKN